MPSSVMLSYIFGKAQCKSYGGVDEKPYTCGKLI